MASETQNEASITEAEDEVSNLELKLKQARLRLESLTTPDGSKSDASHQPDAKPPPPPPPPPQEISSPATHHLLLLSDSALPLGSFAFSSGLESYLAHAGPRSAASFPSFLAESLASHAGTNLPFCLAGHRNPSGLPSLDDQLDAATICTVARRASTAQGRALLGIWERSILPGLASSFSSSPSTTTPPPENGETTTAAAAAAAAVQAVRDFSVFLKKSSSSSTSGPPKAFSSSSSGTAHLAPLFGAVCRATGVPLEQAAYVFLLGHVKALISAAVRASVFGPYQAQRTLASSHTRAMIVAAVRNEWSTRPEDAAQCVPAVDLWVGRHELLYSRIFNS